jgi:hypothetical protein
MDSKDNCIGDCLSKKGVGQGKKEGGLKDGFVFSCCLILLLFFGLPFSMQVNWFLPLSLRAAVTIVVKNRLVNCIFFLSSGCGQGGGGSMVAVASLVVKVVAWWKRNFVSGSSSAFGSVAACGGGGGDYWLFLCYGGGEPGRGGGEWGD